MPAGGYQQPGTPAAVSGPGALSQRTDGGPADPKQGAHWIAGLPYGEGKAAMDMQSAAPMQGAAAPAQPFTFTGLHAPTERPGEPITHGADFGPGAGSEVLPAPVPVTPAAPAVDAAANAIRTAYRAFPSAYLGTLMSQLEAEGR